MQVHVSSRQRWWFHQLAAVLRPSHNLFHLTFTWPLTPEEDSRGGLQQNTVYYHLNLSVLFLSLSSPSLYFSLSHPSPTLFTPLLASSPYCPLPLHLSLSAPTLHSLPLCPPLLTLLSLCLSIYCNRVFIYYWGKRLRLNLSKWKMVHKGMMVTHTNIVLINKYIN